VNYADGTITHERLARLQQAIRAREVSFPAQVPSFPRQHSANIQWRVVTLYFVRGWTCEQLADRYGVTSHRVRQLLRRWVECAAALGYLQKIPTERLMATTCEDAAAA
jgi:hypothetical protein